MPPFDLKASISTGLSSASRWHKDTRLSFSGFSATCEIGRPSAVNLVWPTLTSSRPIKKLVIAAIASLMLGSGTPPHTGLYSMDEHSDHEGPRLLGVC